MEIKKLFRFFINPFSTGKIEKLNFRDSINSTKFKHQYLEDRKCKVYQPAYHQKAYRMLFKKKGW